MLRNSPRYFSTRVNSSIILQLTSYGGTLQYNVRYTTFRGQPGNAYDVILRGARLTAYCKAGSFVPDRDILVSFQLMERDCVKDSPSSSSDFVVNITCNLYNNGTLIVE